MTSTTNNNTSLNTKNIMTRAWEIAKNSYNAHNGSPQIVAQLGSAKSSRDFFSASLKLAWNELKTNSKIYQLVKSLPNKVISRIHEAIKTLFNSKNTLNMSEEAINYKMATTVAHAQCGSKKPSKLMLSKIHNWAYGEQQLALF